MSSEEHQRLLAALNSEDRGPPLAFLVERYDAADSRRRAQPAHRDLLAILASPAPLVQLMKTPVHDIVGRMVHSSSQPATNDYLALAEGSPMLFRWLQPYMGKALPQEVQALLKTLIKGAVACCTPAAASSNPHGMLWANGEEQGLLHAGSAAARPPGEWTRDEALFRTGSFSGLGPPSWEPSVLGGNDVYRQLKAYKADANVILSHLCAKYPTPSYKLIPGLSLFWCTCCEICVAFSMMGVAESPRTVFETLVTRWEHPPKRVIYDNGCNLHHYCLSREPTFFKDTDFLVDQMHFNDHKKCSLNYNTKYYDSVSNSSLAEQKNAIIRLVTTQSAYMNQFTYMRFTRYFLYRMNKQTRKVKAGKCFFRGFDRFSQS